MDPKFRHSNPHFLNLYLAAHLLTLSPSHIFDSYRVPHVSKLRNSNNPRNLCLKPVADKMFLNYFMIGDIVQLVEKTSDLGNES